eukprot:24086-Eustigmatos_ZCMA.PRE.1
MGLRPSSADTSPPPCVHLAQQRSGASRRLRAMGRRRVRHCPSALARWRGAPGTRLRTARWCRPLWSADQGGKSK